MADDVLLNKAATIERCVARAREEYDKGPETFGEDFTRQDAAILNLQRACQSALDMGQYLVRREGLGLPQSAREVFDLLAAAGILPADLAAAMKRMVGFRNIAVHEYQKVQLPITVAIITQHLGEFLAFAKVVLAYPA
ncbi:HepT-like ribonuclease domain-containing protein [Pseudomonas sp. NPDC007930]|uniref:type VII toxin-antitoxin system HepT family RNase toxin n=1 Tax=Pseudomonas sp. NPDC007930 TaxID=3364417 RepID=UPI0036EF57C2